MPFSNKLNKMKKMKFVTLDSVGSIMEVKTEKIYPLQSNGKPDLNMGVFLDEVTNEWFESLSDYDFKTISNFFLRGCRFNK